MNPWNICMTKKIIFLLLCLFIAQSHLVCAAHERKQAVEISKTDPGTIGLLYQLLKVLDLELEKQKIPYWIDFGALLGAMRHGGIIPWDDDIDVCMPVQYMARLKDLAPDFARYGLVLEPVFVAHQNYIGEMVLKRNWADRPVVEIFFVDYDQTFIDGTIKLINTVPEQWFPNAYWYAHEIDELTRIPFGPITVNCPCHGIMRHLYAQYGEDCMTMAVVYNHQSNNVHIHEKIEILDFIPAEYIDDGSIFPLD